ncbi:uncharacterized protein LOC110813206 [Carica papaya]|uniref:uncharacterized protein LOC110813206 n=1 Tax=Carica papaya TaxID=3649 RepID=UPI000B8C88B9|nr:uncharacterized protein LOC110813206 [Carica papaya]
MDDSCAVCADNLEWVAYGACGHREVCSTCVARLRFICGDRRCCICKMESSVVFVTKTSFYGDNELYSHMSTEHYTCHICQRQHPGQYEYYKNYDDLEIHFGREHFLCEDEACLAKKFIVFQTEAEMKRHNTIEHGGRMSRSKRNAALQIPTSFRYRRNSEQDSRRGRGRTFRREHGDDELSIEMARTESTFHDQLSSAIAQSLSDNLGADDIDSIIQPFESLTTADVESSSRYLQALGHNSRNVALEESSFPPLPVGPSSTRQKPRSNDLHDKSMAAHLRRQNNEKVNVINSGAAWPATNRGPIQASSSSSKVRPITNIVPTTLNTSSSPAVPSYASSAQTQHPVRPATVRGLVSAGSPWSLGTANVVTQSSSAPNLSENRQLEHSDFDFPLVSATQMHVSHSNGQALLNVEDVHTANKSLVEKMQAALEYNEEKYTAFKDISGQYRQGLIDTRTYLDYVKQYGLSHLVLELARLCPNAQKQKELVETYNASLRSDTLEEQGWTKSTGRSKDNSGSKKKGKGKAILSEDTNSKGALADSVIGMVRKLQTTYKSSEEEVEVLSKDGYRSSKGKSKATVDEQPREQNLVSQPGAEPGGQNGVSSAAGGGLGEGGGGSKQRKKTSKFQRVRLGDGSMAALLDLKNSDPQENRLNGNQNHNGLPVRGVWRKGGGQKLFL